MQRRHRPGTPARGELGHYVGLPGHADDTSVNPAADSLGSFTDRNSAG